MGGLEILELFTDAQNLLRNGRVSPWNYLGQAASFRKSKAKIKIKPPKPTKTKRQVLTADEKIFYEKMLNGK